MVGKMKVAVMNGIGKMGLVERDIPTAGASEVLVKLEYVGDGFQHPKQGGYR